MAAFDARCASAMTVLVVITTGFAGGGGWMSGRTSDRVPTADVPTADAPTDAHAGHHPQAANDTSAHHSHHGPQAGPTENGGHKSHGHGCENGVCRCDSKCPPRRSGPCGGALRSCSGSGDEAGVGPGPARPFLLSASIRPQPVFDCTRRPDATFVPLTRDLEPVSPPPRTSAV
jgi:hypothetical protein